MNTDLHNAAQQYVGVVNGEIVAHTGVIFFPLQKGKKRVHRFVVLPDYQGVGIGTAFINAVSEIVCGEGYEVNLTTTTPALVGSLRRSPRWTLARYGRNKTNFSHAAESKSLNNAISNNRITYSFWYKPRGGADN